MKSCTCCGKPKPLDHFPKHPDCADGVTAQCKACTSEKTKARRLKRNPQRIDKRKQRITDVDRKISRSLFHGANSRARKFGLPIDIDTAWVKVRLASKRCAVTGIPFIFEPKSPFTPSLDQIQAGKGYTKENTQLVTWVYNAAKHDWGHDAVLEMAKALLRE
jgi:hypothetical protein